VGYPATCPTSSTCGSASFRRFNPRVNPCRNERQRQHWQQGRARQAGAQGGMQAVPGRVVLVHEFRTSRVNSARTNVVASLAESFTWLRPVRSMATRSRIWGLMCSTSNGIRFYDRDVSAALNIRRIAAGPGRPRELSSWLGRPAMPNPGRLGHEWVCVRDRGLLRKWQRRHQRQRQ
ncbi:hypothetical protein QJQ45_027468, partial [Haematococcus lacustris]